jgi:NAD(P)-dependent dehydrogenase (short-subunit alcohol dehydrogenase family)
MTSSDSEFAYARPNVALVTGASAGLGAAMARALARKGWHVFAASRSAGSDPGRGLVDGHVEPLGMDVTQETSISTGLVRVSERGLVLDLLINNAGINVSGVVEEMPREQGRAIMDTNFYGVVDTIRAVLPHMRKRRRGTILTIGSLAGLVAPPGEAYYAASKHALEGFWNHFSMKWRPWRPSLSGRARIRSDQPRTRGSRNSCNLRGLRQHPRRTQAALGGSDR